MRRRFLYLIISITCVRYFRSYWRLGSESNTIALNQARESGLLGPRKDARISGRISAALLGAAKERAHVASDTELLEIALSRLVLEDDFGRRFVRRKGKIPKGIDLEL